MKVDFAVFQQEDRPAVQWFAHDDGGEQQGAGVADLVLRVQAHEAVVALVGQPGFVAVCGGADGEVHFA